MSAAQHGASQQPHLPVPLPRLHQIRPQPLLSGDISNIIFGTSDVLLFYRNGLKFAQEKLEKLQCVSCVNISTLDIKNLW